MKHLCFTAMAVLLMSGRLCAQSGTVDSTYGINGVLFMEQDFESVHYMVTGVDDAKNVIAVVGHYYYDGNSGDSVFCSISRFTEDGLRDATFGDNGEVILTENTDLYIRCLLTFGDGSLLLGGSIVETDGVGSDFYLFKLLPNGDRDLSFGDSSMLIMDMGADDWGTGLVLQNDGKILVSGSSGNVWLNNTDVVVFRLMPDGTLDPSFGVNGIVTTDLTTTNWNIDQAGPIVIQPDGKILVAGKNGTPNINGSEGSRHALLRYHTDGMLDSTFGNGGITLTPPGEVHSNALVLKADQSILLSGRERNISTVGHFATLRQFTKDGIPDSTFAHNGIYQTDSTNNGMVFNALVIQSDQKIIAAGFLGDTLGDKGLLMRFTAQGEPDSTFSNDGIAYLEAGNGIYPNFQHAFLYPEDKITVVGTMYLSADTIHKVFYARFNNAITIAVKAIKAIEPEGILVYPNPATDQVNVVVPETTHPTRLMIFNDAGQMVQELEISGKTTPVNISMLNPGVYWVIARQNNRIMTGKFVKQ